MSVEVATVNEQALQLSPDEKWALIEGLVTSLDCDANTDPQEFARAWDEEIARRVEQIDKREVEMIDGDEVFARLRAMLARRD